MSTQTKSKLFLLIIGILLVTNIGMLMFFTSHKEDGKKSSGNKGRDEMLKEFLQKDIGFSTAQLQQYDSLSKHHRDSMKISFDAIKSSKEQQFKQLGSKGFSDSAISDAIQQSVENQKAMELQMFNHLAAIRKICIADQLPKFDSLFYKVWTRKPDNKKKPEDKK
jgi:Spy/CpxP family protein refolding chaperone